MVRPHSRRLTCADGAKCDLAPVIILGKKESIFFPLRSYTIGLVPGVTLQTFSRIVVFPALARPTMRMRKWGHWYRSLRIWSEGGCELMSATGVSVVFDMIGCEAVGRIGCGGIYEQESQLQMFHVFLLQTVLSDLWLIEVWWWWLIRSIASLQPTVPHARSWGILANIQI